MSILELTSSLAIRIIGFLLDGLVVMLAFNQTLAKMFTLAPINWVTGLLLVVLFSSLFRPSTSVSFNSSSST